MDESNPTLFWIQVIFNLNSMGACECYSTGRSPEEAKIDSVSQKSHKSIIQDLAPAPRYYIGPNSRKKKLQTNHKTLGFVPNQERQIPLTGSLPLEIEEISTRRNAGKRQRIKQKVTREAGMVECIERFQNTRPQKDEDLEMIVGYLKTHFVFGSLNKQDLYSLFLNGS